MRAGASCSPTSDCIVDRAGESTTLAGLYPTAVPLASASHSDSGAGNGTAPQEDGFFAGAQNDREVTQLGTKTRVRSRPILARSTLS